MAELLEQEQPTTFDVLPENHATVRLFLSVSTQWRTDHGRPLGLDYTAVKAACDLLSLPITAKTFTGLQVMERAALEYLARE